MAAQDGLKRVPKIARNRRPTLAKYALKVTRGGVGENTDVFISSSSSLIPNLVWTTYSLTFTAAGTSTNLIFASQVPGAYGPALDNVRISAVPLPAGGLLLLGALGGFAALRRRKA
jgi:hypothetical protein